MFIQALPSTYVCVFKRYHKIKYCIYILSKLYQIGFPNLASSDDDTAISKHNATVLISLACRIFFSRQKKYFFAFLTVVLHGAKILPFPEPKHRDMTGLSS